MDKSTKAAWDNLIEREERSRLAYTIPVLRKLMGKDAFRELYIKQHEWAAFSSFADVPHEDRSFNVVHTLS